MANNISVMVATSTTKILISYLIYKSNFDIVKKLLDNINKLGETLAHDAKLK